MISFKQNVYTHAHTHTHTYMYVCVMVVADVALYMTYLLGDTIQPLACSEEIKSSDRSNTVAC